MDLQGNEWLFPGEGIDQEEQMNRLKEAGLNFSPAFLRLCLQRGLDTVEKIQEATNTQPQLYHDPFMLFQMDRAVERLMTAIEREEAILIYGDYDADGITSTLILLEALEQIGANVSYYVPNRLIDGYGPNKERYEAFINQGIELILTCDNGIAGFDAIDYAMSRGVDVIVSDHHQIQDRLPNAYAIIHPQHPEGTYPFGDLCGAGVALKLAHALLGEMPEEAMELAAIGTIADLVSLTDENRTLIKSGLQLMEETPRYGLELLLDREHSSDPIHEETIGFKVGPKLNAIGRLGDPTPALELLRTQNPEEAHTLYKLILQKNEERKQVVQAISSQVETQVMETGLDTIIIEARQGWQAGVLGIVASKMVEKFHVPSLIFEYQAEKRQYKGSGRSVEGIHLFDWLNAHADLLDHFGGHSQAVGLTISEENWRSFLLAMKASAKEYAQPTKKQKTKEIELLLDSEEISLNFIQELDLLGPYGTDNPKPLLGLRGVKLDKIRLLGANKDHVKFTVYQDTHPDLLIEGVGFSKAHLLENLGNEKVDLAFYLKINEWQGKKLPQILLEGVNVPDLWIRDFRSSKFHNKLSMIRDAIVVGQSKETVMRVKEEMDASNHIVTYSELNQVNFDDYREIVLIEVPSSLVYFNRLMKIKAWDMIDLALFQKPLTYLAGLPSRDEFAQVYRWCQQYLHKIPVNQIIPALHQSIGLAPEKLLCMINVFFELEFVTIEDDCASFEKHHSQTKVDLFSTRVYKTYQERYHVEALFYYRTPQQIKEYINELRN